MSGSAIQKRFLLTGAILLVIGLERLLNASLLGPQATDSSTRFVIGFVCSAVGVFLMGVTLLRRGP